MHLPPSIRREEDENTGVNTSQRPAIGDVVALRLSRRDLLQGAVATGALAALVPQTGSVCAGTETKTTAAASMPAATGAATDSRFKFTECAVATDDTHHVADGYDANVLIRWGDALMPGAPPFDPAHQQPQSQALQFGYNNDYLGFIPIGGRSDHGLLVVNHEYANEELMFPNRGWLNWKSLLFGWTTERLVNIEMMALGGSVLEVERKAGTWQVVPNSKFARRITLETAMRISGPAAGHALLKTNTEPTGTRVNGMTNNCAGGITPWGTWLACEENINYHFGGKPPADKAAGLKRMGVPYAGATWHLFHDRFDTGKEPNEANRFGWVVEIDPFDPNSVPVKRTAMGRFKHEGAGNVVNRDGRFVVYQGDDEYFEYVYRFVTEGKVDATNAAANRDLLDRGTLCVARFDADGTGVWLPLVHGSNPALTEATGFRDQGDVVINARRAADALGATPMDRPEDIEVDPRTGKVYLALTLNDRRKTGDGPKGVNPANPRPANRFGHIIEIVPAGGDHTATSFRWEILLKCGDPSVAEVGATFNPAHTSASGWFANPDNFAFDADGRLWVSTDGNDENKTGRNDGLWAVETEGPGRGGARCFFQVPRGAELCGPVFTPDMETVFVAVQHPGETRVTDVGVRPSTYERPSTRWPDFEPGVPPRPSIVAITKKGGGPIAR